MSDPVEDKIVTKEVNVTRLVEPKFLTLTKKPANQVAFKIVRKDGELRMRRQNPLTRSANPSLAIIFPEDMDEEACKELMAEYGFSEYTLVQEGCGPGGDSEDDTEDKMTGDKKKKRYVAYRKDIKAGTAFDNSNTVTVAVGSGVRLVIERRHTRAEADAQGVKLCSIEFSTTLFPEKEQILDWLRRNAIDFTEDRLENSDTSVIYRRADVPEKAEVGKVEIEHGVFAHVVRQEVTDLPDGMIEVISEAAYGRWGWGQLDFGAMLADVEYTEATEEAVDILERVLEEILFWSDLPLTVRKELVARATSQFTSYVIELMDALPPKTVMINRSMKEQEMTKKDEKQDSKAEDLKRADDEAKAKADAEAKAKAEADAKPVTRAEVAQLITDAVTAAFAARDNKQTTDDKSAAAEGDGSKGKEDADDGAKQVLRSLDALTEGIKAVTTAVTGLTESQKAVEERIAKVEGQTALRSDTKDGKPAPTDVFAGMFRGGKK